MGKLRSAGLILMVLIFLSGCIMWEPIFMMRASPVGPVMYPGEEEALAPVPEVKDEPLTPEAEKRIKELVPQLNSDDWQTREKATDELIKMGKMVIPFAIEALQHSEPEVRLRATRILNLTGGWVRVPALAEKRIRTLISEVNTEDLNLEYIAEGWSLRYSGELSLYQLESATQQLYAGLKSAGAEIVPALLKNLEKASDPKAKAILLYIIGKFPSREGTSTLLKLLQDEEKAIRYLALDTLGKIKDETAVPEIIKAGQGEDENMRLLAYSALSNYQTKEAMEFFLKGLSDTDTNVRFNAFYGLRQGSQGESFGYNPYDSATRRTAAIARWQKWAKESSGKPFTPKPPQIASYLCLRDIQKIKDSFLNLSFWEEDEELKTTATKLYEQYLSKLCQQINLKPAIVKQLINSLTGIQIAYYGISEVELKGADDRFHKQIIPIVFAQIGFTEPDRIKELFAGPLKEHLKLKEKYQDKEILCIEPGIWAYIHEQGISLSPDKEIFKGIIDAGGLDKRLAQEEAYQVAKERLAEYCYFWGYIQPVELMTSSMFGEASANRMGLKFYLHFESAIDLTAIKSYGFGITIKDDHPVANEFIRLAPEHNIYRIIRSEPAEQQDFLKLMPQDAIFTATWSFSKDASEIWKQGFKYITGKIRDFGEIDESEEEIIESMTREFGMKPEDLFAQVNNGAGLAFTSWGDFFMPNGFFIFPAKDLPKAKETVKKFEAGKLGDYQAKDYKGIKIFSKGDEEYRRQAYTFIENNFIYGGEDGTKVLESLIDAYKEGKTIDKLLVALQEEGLNPEVANASLLAILNLSQLKEIVLVGEFGEILESLELKENTVLIGSVALDKPDQININWWSNLKISSLTHNTLKLLSEQMLGEELQEEAEEFPEEGEND